MGKIINVLVVGLTGGVGGVETFICNVNRTIDHEQFRMDFLVHQQINPKYLADIIENCGTIYYVPGVKSGLIKYIKGIFRFYKEHNDYQIVHLNECGASFFLYTLPLLFDSRMKLIVHSHNGDSSRRILHKIFRFFQNLRVDKKCACSDIAAAWMFGKKTSKTKDYTIIHNGIQVEKYRYNPVASKKLKSEFGLEGKFVLGSVARFERQKNHVKMINIFWEYKKRNPNSCLVLVGEGSEMEHIKKIVSERNIVNDVLFLGVRNDISDLLSMFDVFLLPSLYEGLPFVTIEAQAASLPMVVSNVVSKEIDITPLIHRVDLDEEDEVWCHCIEKLQMKYVERNTSTYRKMLRSAGYDIDNSIKLLEQMYKDLVGRGINET